MKKFQLDTSSKTIMSVAIIAMLVIVLLSGCAPTKKQPTANGGVDPIGDAGLLGTMLGCVFSPADCEKFKKESAIKGRADHDAMTKEFEALDQGK